MIKAGVLSDTHLCQLDESYLRNCARAFSDCEIIFHAGDLTNLSVLEPFANKRVYAVSGNMCNAETRKALPEKRLVKLEGITIGLTHGAGSHTNIEDRVFEAFPNADCIIYGHTHLPVCHNYGPVLLINPGSFQPVSRWGGPGTYAILTIDNNSVRGKIHQL
ncbi:MAG: metallophosphatase family protein [Desulforhopalus sp.]|nr:metallophosphatase family protein [Desulforhopalus sp.]